MTIIYSVQYNNNDYKKIYEKYYFLCSEYTKNKIKNFIKEQDVCNCILSEIIFKEILARFYNLNYDFDNLKRNSYGKPYMSFEKKRIHFNISHSENMVVCAISDENIGIDVEKIDYSIITFKDIFCSKKEMDYLSNQNLDIDDEIKILYTIWTVKESFLKLLGVGLHYPLKKLSFKLQKGIIQKSGRNIKKVHFDTVLKENYIITISSKHINYRMFFLDVNELGEK